MPREGRTSARRRRGDRETEGKIGETAAASLESTCGRDDAREGDGMGVRGRKRRITGSIRRGYRNGAV